MGKVKLALIETCHSKIANNPDNHATTKEGSVPSTGSFQPKDPNCHDPKIHTAVFQRLFRSIPLLSSASNDVHENLLLPADTAPQRRDHQAAGGHPGSQVRSGGGREDGEGAREARDYPWGHQHPPGGPRDRLVNETKEVRVPVQC